MKQIIAKEVLDLDQIKKLEGTFITEKHIDHLIEENTIVTNKSGKLIASPFSELPNQEARVIRSFPQLYSFPVSSGYYHQYLQDRKSYYEVRTTHHNRFQGHVYSPLDESLGNTQFFHYPGYASMS